MTTDSQNSHRHSAELESLVTNIRTQAGPNAKIVFVSGNFNIIHPGHLRLLSFAADCGDFLVVGVTKDGTDGCIIAQPLRLEGVQSIASVNYAVALNVSPEEFIRCLRPNIVVKGKEHEQSTNVEHDIVKEYGGELLFSSGDIRFSSLNLLKRELQEYNLQDIQKPTDFPLRHGFSMSDLSKTLERFKSLRVIVIGDLIVDEYITCDPLGMSQEDPTIVVTPIQRDVFVGGAGIVAAHAQGLGARVHYFSVSGNDATAQFALQNRKNRSVYTFVLPDESRPTTLKQRYRARGKTLLRVSHLRQHAISKELANALYKQISTVIEDCDLLIFSDFNYGTLPQPLVDKITKLCKAHGVRIVADSQSSSQIGDVSRFKGAQLITPTEREARLAVRDHGYGLPQLADALIKKVGAEHLFMTLGAEGMLIYSPQDPIPTDLLPAMNSAPRDVSGAGDSLLTCASMALAVGASIWEAAFLGSIAAACQVGRVGNTPLTQQDIAKELRS